MLANSVDPDQTPQNVASEPDLHCLHMTPNRYLVLKWLIDLKRTYSVMIKVTTMHSYHHHCALIMYNLNSLMRLQIIN